MYKAKILIIGDSFSSKCLASASGWPVLLEKHFDITNLSCPGIGEYKILKQLYSADLKKYDAICASHTSPNRVHAEYNPLYLDDHLYHTSDIIFSDVENKNNKIANSMMDYFKFVFDQEYYNFIHHCCCEKINQATENYKTLHITHFNWDNLFVFDNFINFYDVWKSNKGSYNHYSKKGNQIVAENVCSYLRNFL